LIYEENSMEGFKLVKEKADLNAFVHFKEDVENPIFRVDMLIERITPKQIFEVLKDH
jgi:hypothetical protein